MCKQKKTIENIYQTGLFQETRGSISLQRVARNKKNKYMFCPKKNVLLETKKTPKHMC